MSDWTKDRHEKLRAYVADRVTTIPSDKQKHQAEEVLAALQEIERLKRQLHDTCANYDDLKIRANKMLEQNRILDEALEYTYEWCLQDDMDFDADRIKHARAKADAMKGEKE